jgi:phosphate/sulfate permease
MRAVDDDDSDIIDGLNRIAVNRSAAVARAVGSLVTAAGAIGLLAWLWLTYRTQTHASAFSFTFEDPGDDDASLSERLDVLSNTVSVLVTSSAALALGLGLRLLADYVQTRVGGNVTGYSPLDLPDES